MCELLKIENVTIVANKKHKKLHRLQRKKYQNDAKDNRSLDNGSIKITDNVSLSLNSGEIMGIIGESGCGKSITALSILGLTNSNIQISSGNIFFENVCLNNLTPENLRKICGSKIGMVFQEPMTALNPVFTIEKQLSEPLKLHLKLSKSDIKARCIELLESVGIKNASSILKCYPHQLSGGMRQRVVIAMAIACKPKLLIADEPTTALDVTIQSQILHILKKLVKENNMALLIISHDIGVISKLSENVSVMYAGQIIEQDTKSNIITNPLHPYTSKLINSAKELSGGCKHLTIVNGSVPRPEENIAGCKFSARCEFCTSICKDKKPPLIKKDSGNGYIRCWKYVNK